MNSRYQLHLILLNSFVVISHLSFTQPSQQFSRDVEERIRKVENSLAGWVWMEDSVNTWNLEKRMKEQNIHGLSIAVINNGKLEWAKGYGFADTASKKPVTIETLFQAGSISKSLNSIGILKLVQEKKVDLHTDINNYLRSWKFPYDTISKDKKITLANLLSHSAGLTIHGFPGYPTDDTIPSLLQILDGLPPANTKAVRSMFEPGLRFRYSGGGTTISQILLMDVTGEAYDAYMWNHVLKPLGMEKSSYAQPPAPDMYKYLATGYKLNGAEVKGKYHIYPEQAAAGLWTNPTDLSKWMIETQLSYVGKSSKVLSPEITRLQLTPYIDSSLGLGVFLEKHGGEKYFGHNGSDQGFLSLAKASIDGGRGVVIMINSNNGRVLNEVLNSVASVYGWNEFYKPVKKKVVKVDDSIIDSYAGDYLLENDTVTISRKGTESFVTINRNTTFKIYFNADNEFFSPGLNQLEFKIDKDETGKVKEFYFKEGDAIIRARKL
ncbi:MAG TPA: serine hydrolase domain-containing protein [Chitinophagaceae bacterium]